MPVAVSVHEVDSLPSVFLVLGILETVVHVQPVVARSSVPHVPKCF
jgi:hypothetical protein